jgi:tetratricopeptide (TPR) repeat protein
MSANPAAPIPVQKSRTKLIVAVLSALLLVLIYGAGFIVLPVTIMSNFQGRNCDTVLSLHKAYTALYPGFMEDTTLPVFVNECQSYLTASSYEQGENWLAAHEAYQAYSSTYPNGLFAAQAHEHGALTLMNVVKEQIQQEQYKEGLAGLELILSNFADTDVSAEAWPLIPSTFVSWGSGLRDEGQFEQAEQAFYRFKIWGQDNQKPDSEMSAQRELAQLYVAWGLSARSQKQYENALAKFEQAISADSQSEFASTEQAKAGKRSVYVEWGNELLEHDQVSEALEKFGSAVSLADGEEDDGARDALAKGYLHRASDLSADEDFFGALEHMETAQESARTQDMKQAVEVVLQETYLAFSASTGRQARQVIGEALVSVCKENDTPEYPIFGLDEETVRVGLFGVEDQLPEDLAARTPGEMHYVACVQVERRVPEVDGSYAWFRGPAGIFRVTLDEVRRIQVFWTITIREIETVKILGTETFEGGPPPPFPKGGASGGGDLEGPPPPQDALKKWLLSIIQ